MWPGSWSSVRLSQLHPYVRSDDAGKQTPALLSMLRPTRVSCWVCKLSFIERNEERKRNDFGYEHQEGSIMENYRGGG